MGYYSEVAICMKKEDYEVLKEKSAKLEYDMIDIATTTRFDEEDNTVAIYWSSVKWYSDFEEVKLIEDFLQTLDTYKFIRLGEDYEDNEFLSGPEWADGICDKIHMCRDIEIDI